ncbi:MAG: hypothetical protein E7118_01980 [Bacteroidales bacterium]|nr:hypothetical protein [Bacteroidales bacterium]
MKSRTLLLVFAISVILQGCGVREVKHLLCDVESFIYERPDSALAILDTMDRSSLSTPGLRAHHALLHAMALDKNYIDVTDDSLARIAVDYYSKHGPKKYEARSRYYLGLSYYYREDYNNAIIEFTKAESPALESDSLYLGMLKVVQAETYAKTYNTVEQYNYLQSAIDIFSKIKAKKNKDVATLMLAQSISNNSQSSKALSILDELMDTDDLDEIVKMCANATYAFIYSTTEYSDHEKAVQLYSDLFKNCEESFIAENNYWAYAYSLSCLGYHSESVEVIDGIQDKSSINSSYWQYRISKGRNEWYTALKYLEEYNNCNTVVVSDVLRQSLALSQRDYYESQSELAESKARNATLMTVSVITLSFFLIIIILLIFLRYIKRQREVKESYLRYLNEIKRQLDESANESYPELKRKYIQLYKSKYDTIGMLYEQLANTRGLINASDSVYRKVVDIVGEFEKDYQSREKFESMLDDDFDGIMTNLRNEMPDLKEADYVVFRLLVAGFDATVISHLLHTSINTVYIRKSRIKSRIVHSDPPHRAQFLEAME